jgi:hypothetical protein
MDIGIMNPSLPSVCAAPYVLVGSKCVGCDSGFYARPVPQPNACPGEFILRPSLSDCFYLACVSPCVTCTSETACSSCVPNYSFDILTSTCTSCVPGTYSVGGTVSSCTGILHILPFCSIHFFL